MIIARWESPSEGLRTPNPANSTLIHQSLGCHNTTGGRPGRKDLQVHDGPRKVPLQRAFELPNGNKTTLHSLHGRRGRRTVRLELGIVSQPIFPKVIEYRVKIASLGTQLFDSGLFPPVTMLSKLLR